MGMTVNEISRNAQSFLRWRFLLDSDLRCFGDNAPVPRNAIAFANLNVLKAKATLGPVQSSVKDALKYPTLRFFWVTKY